MNAELYVGSNQEEVSRKAAECFVAAARHLSSSQQKFAVVLAGGSTPRRTYQLLAQEPLRSAVQWKGVHFFWGDERAVPPDHPDSNYGMARATLLQPLGVPPAQVHRICGEHPDPHAAAQAYEQEIARFFSQPPLNPPPSFDFVFLGVGPDGHIASLFPGTAALQERKRWVVANWVPQLRSWRITLTLPVLNAASCLCFLVMGAEKAPVVRRALANGGEAQSLPVAQLRPKHRVLWFLDHAAASELPKSLWHSRSAG